MNKMKVLAQLAFLSFLTVQVTDAISTDETLTKFLLYTRDNQGTYDYQELVFANYSSIESSNFDSGRKTKILVHGFTDHGKVGWVMGVKNRYLEKEDCNVISVDWEDLAGPAPWYEIAANNAKKVGARTGQLLKFMQVQFQLSPEDVHVIGFSLGGQLVAFVGQEMNGTLKRITGLDPAGFLFHSEPTEGKLSEDDAQFVDVIHTAGLWIGTDEKVGHVDFYPNGGKAPQPGCEHEDSFGLDCSHARAPAFFEESINSEIGFDSVMCGSWDDYSAGLCGNLHHKLMGEPADISRPGIYFLRTNSQRPFAIDASKA